MPHLWMFLLEALTPPEHEVLLIDGNTQPMSDDDLVRYAVERNVGLVGIGAMTRMVAKAYRVADALRAAGVPVVMGGPHVTEAPDEALGRDGGPRHADAVALGEADETWPLIVQDAARGALKETYSPVDAFGQERKPSLDNYPQIPWDRIDITQFNRIPGFFRAIMAHYKTGWETFHIIPIESGRGCPYGCDFCSTSHFFKRQHLKLLTTGADVYEVVKKHLAINPGAQFTILDEEFLLDKKRALEFRDKVMESGNPISICLCLLYL